MSDYIERPRYTCALGGAIATVSALPDAIPILHAPSGCAGNFTWTQAGGCGLQTGGYCGGLSMPGSNVLERDVVFGGAERLEEEVTSTLEVMDGKLYVIITSCVTEVIGDDIAAVARPFRERGVPLIFAETGGFKGNSYHGYDLVLQSLLRDFAEKTEKKEARKVNLWGITPFLDPFWRGNLEELRRLLTGLGLEVNSFFTADDSVDGIRAAGSAALNIVVSDVYGMGAAEAAREVHGTPYITAPLPVGPSATDAFLRQVSRALGLPEEETEQLIQQENRKYYRFLENFTDCYNDMDLQRYVAVVGDANYAVGLTKFLADDLGWLPEVTATTDLLDETQTELLSRRLAELDSGLRPRVIFATDSSQIREATVAHWKTGNEPGNFYANPRSPAFVIGSSLDRELAKELGAAHLSVSFPVANRAVLDRGYTGYRGGLRLIEDLVSTIVIGR
ncbi:MAG TPA: nitrogenase component 1 [Patescibacteria group bacterium]|nr:nitrogenase component 1 [Patescibacteria group bacterium]